MVEPIFDSISEMTICHDSSSPQFFTTFTMKEIFSGNGNADISLTIQENIMHLLTEESPLLLVEKLWNIPTRIFQDTLTPVHLLYIILLYL